MATLVLVGFRNLSKPLNQNNIEVFQVVIRIFFITDITYKIWVVIKLADDNFMIYTVYAVILFKSIGPV